MLLLRNRGFSLIELVIVIAIIGILAAIGVPQFSKYRRTSHNSLALSDLKNAIIAQEAYFVGNSVYAGSVDRLIISHNLIKSKGVELTVIGNESYYTINAYHPSGDRSYTYLGPGGEIKSN